MTAMAQSDTPGQVV